LTTSLITVEYSHKEKEMAKKRGRPLGLVYGSQMQTRLHPSVREAMERLAKKNGSKITEEMRIAIRNHLKTNNHWPANLS
jgi:hypothetical protein